MSHATGTGNQNEVELNLAPIIDCFTVLVTFLLATTTFMSIGTLDAGIAASGTESAADVKKNDLQINIHLNKDNSIKLSMTGSAQSASNITQSDGNLDYTKLQDELKKIKNRFPTADVVILSAENTIDYLKVVQTLESVRKSHAAVVLGGF